MNKRTFSIIVVLLLALLAGGCGYALVGRGNFLPPEIETIQVPAFVNRTTRVELEQRVTQAVADEFVSRGRMKLVSSAEQADAVLQGVIQSFGINPVGFDPQGRATQYQIVVTAQIELVDKRGEEPIVLWKNDQYYFTENYPINPDAFDTFDQETRAINEIAERFAETLVSTILEGF